MIIITVFICIISSVFGQIFCQEGGGGVLLCDSPSGRESGEQKVFSQRLFPSCQRLCLLWTQVLLRIVYLLSLKEQVSQSPAV